MKNNLPEIEINGAMICHRLKCNKAFTLISSGNLSPLLSIEPTIVSTIIQLSRILQSINLSQGLLLVNIIIDGTPAQADLVEWKLNICCNGDNMVKVGTGYLRGFREGNKDTFVSKKGF